MRALVYDNYAINDDFAQILKIENIPDPILEPNEVIFQVKAAALNYDDIWGMRGKPLQVPLPHISGTDAAGVVTAVGDDVKRICVGDRIVSHGNMSCRICKMCTSGREYNCKRRKIWGFETGPMWGGYCEKAHLPEVNVIRIPDNISYEDAAAASMTLLTSWHMLVGRAAIHPGQLVLVMGGASGVGSFGIQIAKLFGCTVIATASGDKLDKLLELGADYAINHRRDDWDAKILDITNELNQGIDVIFEHIGGSHWNKELALLKRGATIVTTGATTGYNAETDLRRIFSEGISILGSTQGTRAELEQGFYWMSQGKIKAIIDSIHSLDDAAKAHTKMLSGNVFGKILIKP